MTTPPEQDRTRPPGPPPSDPGMRASDADRAATVRVLQDAVGRGLLTPDEGSERMAAAWTAVHVRDLGPLTADLPAHRTPAPAPGWGVLATMAAEQVRSTVRGARTGRLSPARVAVAVAVVLLVLLLLGSLVRELLHDGHGPGRGGFGPR
jgi:hypothetical protein